MKKNKGATFLPTEIAAPLQGPLALFREGPLQCPPEIEPDGVLLPK